MSFRIVSLSFLLCAASVASLAQGTKVWTESHMEEWEKGRPQGVAISSDGSLSAAPASTLTATTPSTYIWALTSDSVGNAYVATGSPATVLRIARDGKSTTIFKTKDMSVQAIALGPDGSVYAATLPNGKVYRIPAGATDLDEEKATVVFDPAKLEGVKPDAAPKYIWDLAFGPDGALYIATGGPAAVYRVRTPAGAAHAERFFESDEQHIRALLFEKDGSLLAGSDGDGLVYRIDKEGKGFILFNAPKREITALAESPSGQIYVASVGEKGKSGLPPLPVQGIATVTATITIVTPGSVQASNNNALVPDGSEVYELDHSGAARKLWAPHDDVVYGLRWTPDGLLAATGNRGRIYRVQENGEFADIAHLEASQATGFASAADGFYVGTSNGGKLFHLGALTGRGQHRERRAGCGRGGAVGTRRCGCHWVGLPAIRAGGERQQCGARLEPLEAGDRGDVDCSAAGALCAVEGHAEAGHQRPCRLAQLSAGECCACGRRDRSGAGRARESAGHLPAAGADCEHQPAFRIRPMS